MKKLLLVSMLAFATCSACFADSVYVIQTDVNAPSIMDSIQEKTSAAAQKTGEVVKEGAVKAGDATKKCAIKAGKATKKEAIKAGKAAKKGARKATNWSAQKIEKGAQKIIEQTEDTTVETHYNETTPVVIDETHE